MTEEFIFTPDFGRIVTESWDMLYPAVMAFIGVQISIFVVILSFRLFKKGVR